MSISCHFRLDQETILTEEDLQKVIEDWKDIANNMEGLTINL